MFPTEIVDHAAIARHQRGRHQLGEIGDEDLFRRIAHGRWRIDHQGLGMNALEHVRERDVVHVEGRILAHMDHVLGGKIHPTLFAQHEMLALGLVEYGDRRRQGRNDIAAQGQRIGRVMQQFVAARLRFQHHGERGIAARIDGGDMVHLDRDFELHVGPFDLVERDRIVTGLRRRR
ncbi:hypothetical protein D9M68_800390 [compost metagenome]